MNSDNFLNQLRELELTLQEPATRSNPDRVKALLHEAFVEIGRSGRSYNRADIILQLSSEQPSGTICSQDFSVANITDGVALLTYKSFHLNEQGDASRHTLRSSIWQRTKHGWQMRYHQGTPTASFATDVN